MIPSQLAPVIRAAVAESIGGADRVAIAYSGGIDSAIVSALASDIAAVCRYTCAVKGSKDHAEALSIADDPRNIVLLSLTENDLIGLVKEAGHALRTSDPVAISYTVPVLSVIHGAEEEVILTGAGADELFGGYAKYERIGDPIGQMAADKEKMLSEVHDLKIHTATSGKRLETPFTDRRVMEFAESLPLEQKVHQGERKIALRQLAKELSLAAQDRPKRAAQYSSGVLKEMKRLAKASGSGLGEWTAFVVTGSHGIP